MNGLDRMQLQRLEQEAHRLRREYAHDLAVRAVVSIDLAVRRLAYRIEAGLRKDRLMS